MTRGDASPAAWTFWLLVVAALLGYAGWRTWFAHQAALEYLGDLEPRHARVLGLGADRLKLEAAAERAAKDLARHVYPVGRDLSQAGNDAQQRVRDSFAKAGLDVISIQLLPARTTPQFDRIPVSLRLEGEMTALQTALAALPAMSPTLFVEGFSLQGASGLKPDGPVRVVAQFDLFVLRARH